jgi:hypothetical protein
MILTPTDADMARIACVIDAETGFVVEAKQLFEVDTDRQCYQAYLLNEAGSFYTDPITLKPAQTKGRYSRLFWKAGEEA